MALHVVLLALTAFSTTSSRRYLPPNELLIGYATSCPSTNVIPSVKDGVNVLIWFESSLVVDSGGEPKVSTGLNFTCIAAVANKLAAAEYPTTHMLSIGGWNAPHPNTSLSGLEWWRVWKAWNTHVVARDGWIGFDGIDWDLEGNDASASPWNTFTAACLRLVASMSRAAHNDGYIVSLVPPQTYLDPSNARFDRSLRHVDVNNWKPDFHYHGWNAYAALLTPELAGPLGSAIYDFVSIQLYESWAPADYATIVAMEPPAQYLSRWAASVNAGWAVAFASGDPTLGIANQTVTVRPSQLVLGLSRGSGAPPSASAGKSVYFSPETVKSAWEDGRGQSGLAQRLRGVMWWEIEIDRGTVNGSTSVSDCRFSACFGSFIPTRNGSERRACVC